MLPSMGNTTSFWNRFYRAVTAFAAGTIVTINYAAPPSDLLDGSHADVRAVVAMQDAATPGLMAQDGVLGTAVGLDDNGQTSLVVYVDKENPAVDELVKSLPPQIRGIGVSVVRTEKFLALRGKPSGSGTTVSHKAKQSIPIQLGTSGGWRNDLANGFCCAGTLGALIEVNGSRYILSNYHVFEADIVSGGNGLVATDGSYVIQPGLIDVNCSANAAQNVATLKKIYALPGHNVDCSIAQVINGQVDSSGKILEIGTISRTTLTPSLNQGVKKSGRTTGLTTSKITGLNATISVTYENECGGGTAFTKTFTGQVIISNKGSGFLAGGDSGSLMVENAATNPRPVGLLYAGSSTLAVANPINEVLAYIGAALGGQASFVGQ